MENAVIDLLGGYGIAATGSVEAPGVYVGTSKIAALGLRITRGACYHGLALNVDMDLTPFHAIDPCGYPGLAVTQLRDLGVTEPGNSLPTSSLAFSCERALMTTIGAKQKGAAKTPASRSRSCRPSG